MTPAFGSHVRKTVSAPHCNKPAITAVPRRTAVSVYATTIALALSGIVLGVTPGWRIGAAIVTAWAIVLVVLGRRLARVPQL